MGWIKDLHDDADGAVVLKILDVFDLGEKLKLVFKEYGSSDITILETNAPGLRSWFNALPKESFQHGDFVPRSIFVHDDAPFWVMAVASGQKDVVFENLVTEKGVFFMQSTWANELKAANPDKDFHYLRDAALQDMLIPDAIFDTDVALYFTEDVIARVTV